MFYVWYKPEYIKIVAWLAGVTGLLGTAVIAIVMKWVVLIIKLEISQKFQF
jgi:hypothetical protein